MKVRIKIPQKRLQMISNETFVNTDEANMFIQKSIDRQYALCCKGWGLTSVNESESNNIKNVIFTPACTVLGKPLKVTFEILN